MRANRAMKSWKQKRDQRTPIGHRGKRNAPDLVWDNEAPGLCVRVHGNGEKSFIFVYRRDKRQRFVRIGTTPTWSLEGARRWPKELRSAVDRGDEPET
jgi:hypothetical protein